MLVHRKAVSLGVILAGAWLCGAGAAKKGERIVTNPVESSDPPAVLWREPDNVAERNLFYGPGGEQHVPRGPFTFVREDRKGSQPKFDVVDQDDIEWRIKLGPEARPETVCTRLVWAVGYFADEDYFLSDVHVDEIPLRLHRGQQWISPRGMLHNARLKRRDKAEKKEGQWSWRHNAFTGTRELNGLRVMMALINNWDLKDINNAVYREKGDEDHERIYAVSDLGASLGGPGIKLPLSKARDNLRDFSRSRFITHETAEYVDFETPHRPGPIWMASPSVYAKRIRIDRIGRKIPRADARWIGELLARLTPEQIRDAFRAGGYSAEEVEAYAHILEDRIAQLNQL